VVIERWKAQRLPVILSCAIHPWMRGWLRVFDHPYYAITDADGRFEIRSAPAGRWRLKVWHEENGWRGGRKGRDGEKVVVQRAPVTDLGDLALNP
jgi:hypothetical protein